MCINYIDAKLIRLSKARQFKLEPSHYTVNVSVKKHCLIQKKPKVVYKMVQFHINLNEATTVHKLKGISKDTIVITTWPQEDFENWEYTVLSYILTMECLHLLEEIDMEKSFAPTEDLMHNF